MIDDFFAQDFDSVKAPKVKKHKKRKLAQKVPSLLDLGEFSAKKAVSVVAKRDTDTATGSELSIPKPINSFSNITLADTFESELGISSVSEIAVSDQEQFNDAEVATQMDTKNEQDIESELVQLEVFDEINKVDNNSDDNFDSDLKAYQEQILKSGSELLQRINQDLDGDVEFDGTTVPIGSILICINVIVEIGDFKSDKYQLKLKSGKNVQKVIKLFVNQFNSQYNSRVIAEEYVHNLVIYFPKLNLYLEPEMSFSTVVRCKDNLDTTFDSTKGVFGISCDARLLVRDEAEKAMKEREFQIKNELQRIENDSTSQGNVVTIKIIDKYTKKEIVLKTSSTAPFSEVVELYRIRAELPDLLDLSFKVCDDSSQLHTENVILPAQFESSINELINDRSEYLTAFYNMSELEELRKSYEQTENVDDPTTSQKHTINELLSEESMEEGNFTVTLLVSEKKRYKVKVKPTTQISELILYFSSRNPVEANKKVELMFDNEPLPPEEEIQFTEIEEDDIIDVIIRE